MADAVEETAPAGLADIHCHCLPGLDDGPEDLDGSLRLCEALVEDGFETVVATPHQLGRYEGVNTREVVLASLEALRQELRDRGVPLALLAGADVRIDDRLDSLATSGDALTIADARRYLLLELPHSFFVDPTHVVHSLGNRGVRAVLTHPERHRYLQGAVEPVEVWRRLGAVVQVTAGSLLGDFGRTAMAYAWRLVHARLVDVVATDAHDTQRRPPRMQAAIERLRFEVGGAETDRLCRDNPWRIVRGEPIADSNRGQAG